jgi:sec-independent protein translocase protein TatA
MVVAGISSRKAGGGPGLAAEESIMGELFQPTHLLVIGVIVFLIFGAKRLPDLGKGLGEGLKGFKDGLKNAGSEPAPMAAQQQNAAPAQPKAEPVEPK